MGRSVNFVAHCEFANGAHHEKVASWTPERCTFWEAFVFDKDKRFVYDSVFSNPGSRLSLSGENEIPSPRMNTAFLKGTAISRVEELIEK